MNLEHTSTKQNEGKYVKTLKYLANIYLCIFHDLYKLLQNDIKYQANDK